MQTRINLVKFTSLDPDIDPLIEWLQDLDFWNDEIEDRVKEADMFLPLDIETDFRDMFGIPLNLQTQSHFSHLLASCIGIRLETLGLDEDGWKDPETCTGKITSLLLGRVQDEKLLKATKIAFDPRAQYLVGVYKRPFA